MIIARQSTARTVTVGPVLDADGVAVTDGVVADFKISKNGGAPAALDGSATLTHRNTGHYSLALTANDLDTVGQAEVVIDDTVNACPVKEITVVEEAVYDALFAASAAGYATGSLMSIARSTGALLGTDESTGVSVASAASSAGNEVDILANNTSRGLLTLYLVFTPTTAPDAGGIVSVDYFDARVTAQPVTPPQVFPVATGGMPAAVVQKIRLGAVKPSRYGKITFRNGSGSALTNVAVLYALEKEG
jgi:hypothetical protein